MEADSPEPEIEGDTPESEIVSTASSFNAYGWCFKAGNPFDFDNPKLLLDYFVQAAPLLMSDSNTQRHAKELLALVDRVLAADTEYRSGNSEEGYRKALVAMYMLGVAAKSAQEEQEFPSKRRLEMLKREVGLHSRFVTMKESMKDKEVGRRVAKSIACDYARIKWTEDKEKTIRTGDMTEIVWAWMAEHERLIEHRPSTMDGLKVWIREVAVDFPHAQKRGPKGKK
ncbi:hypothetical protein D9M68_553040 [compost metagenome]